MIMYLVVCMMDEENGCMSEMMSTKEILCLGMNESNEENEENNRQVNDCCL